MLASKTGLKKIPQFKNSDKEIDESFWILFEREEKNRIKLTFYNSEKNIYSWFFNFTLI